MIRKIITFNVLLLLLFNLSAFSQKKKASVSKKRTRVVSVFPNTTFHLKSGLSLSTANRMYYTVDLPYNSKGFYYSVTASKQGGVDVNLLAQLARLYDFSGVTSSVLSSLFSPQGTSVVNIYFTNPDEAFKFSSFKKFKYYHQYSRERLKNGIVNVDFPGGGTVCFCFQNPSDLNGVYVNFEVVAIIEE